MLGMLMNLGHVRHSDKEVMMSCATTVGKPFDKVQEELPLRLQALVLIICRQHKKKKRKKETR